MKLSEIVRIISAWIAILIIVYGTYKRLRNPYMTNVQALLEWWYIWLGAILFAIPWFVIDLRKYGQRSR